MYWFPLTEQRTQSLDNTWIYDLKRGKLSAALLPFQVKGDTASYWLSESRGWVYDQRGRLMFCPVNKTNKTTIWTRVVKIWSLQVKKGICLISLTSGLWHSKASSNFSNLDLLGNLYRTRGSEWTLKAEDWIIHCVSEYKPLILLSVSMNAV